VVDNSVLSSIDISCRFLCFNAIQPDPLRLPRNSCRRALSRVSARGTMWWQKRLLRIHRPLPRPSAFCGSAYSCVSCDNRLRSYH
jgi:hypothetical protein